MTDALKFCIDCKWHKSPEEGQHEHICKHNDEKNSVNLITGRCNSLIMVNTCFDMRLGAYSLSNCSELGRWFEPKEAVGKPNA